MTTNSTVPSVPLTAFAGFFEAAPARRTAIVKQARNQHFNPTGWAGRDFYRELRVTLRQTHWLTGKIDTFENAADALVSNLRNKGKSENYQQLCNAYIEYWKVRDAAYFSIPSSEVTIVGLTIRVSPKIGMGYSGDELALKLWFNAKTPTRQFRQVIQYMMEKARQQQGWPQNWQPRLWDVRRKEILQPVPLPIDFRISLEGQAAAFQQTWESLGESDSTERA